MKKGIMTLDLPEITEELIEIDEEQYNELQNKLEKLKKLYDSGALGELKKKHLSFLSPHDHDQKS